VALAAMDTTRERYFLDLSSSVVISWLVSSYTFVHTPPVM
jgi:hypothetical protein